MVGHPLMAIWGLIKEIMGAGLHEKLDTLISNGCCGMEILPFILDEITYRWM